MSSDPDKALIGSTREFLSRRVRIFSLFVYMAAIFGLGLLFTVATGLKEWTAVVGALLVLFGAVYATALNSYVLYRVWKQRRRKTGFDRSQNGGIPKSER